MRLYLRLLSYLGPYRGLLAASFLATLGFAAFDAGRETAREGLVVGRGSDRVDA